MTGKKWRRMNRETKKEETRGRRRHGGEGKKTKERRGKGKVREENVK